MPKSMKKVLAYDDEDAKLLGGCLRGAHSSTLDAMGCCSGEPHYPDFKRTEPSFAQIEVLRAQLDRIERLAKALGHPIWVGSSPGAGRKGGRRGDVERYLAHQIEEWQKLDSVSFS